MKLKNKMLLCYATALFATTTFASTEVVIPPVDTPNVNSQFQHLTNSSQNESITTTEQNTANVQKENTEAKEEGVVETQNAVIVKEPYYNNWTFEESRRRVKELGNKYL